jgi:hypothetical protein
MGSLHDATFRVVVDSHFELDSMGCRSSNDEAINCWRRLE